MRGQRGALSPSLSGLSTRQKCQKARVTAGPTACCNRRWVGATAEPLLGTVGISHALREQDDTADLLLKQGVPKGSQNHPSLFFPVFASPA